MTNFFPNKVQPKEVKEFHTNDDVDSGALAHHHTLGLGINQAARGSDFKALHEAVDAYIIANNALITALQNADVALDGRLDSLEAPTVATTVSATGGSATGNATTGTWQNDATLPSTTFVAPITGAVLIWIVGYIRNATAGQNASLSLEARVGNTIGSGAIVKNPSFIEAVSNYNTNYIRSVGLMEIEGLTPGSTYNVRGMYNQTNANGAQWATPTIKVMAR